MALKVNEYENKRAKALRWGYLFAGVAFLVFVVFIIRIVILQNNSNVESIEKNYIQTNYREDTVKAARGNLYASDGSILATTVMKYNIYVDFKTIKDTLYEKRIGALSDSLGKMFNRPRQEFRKMFNEQYKKKNQYFSLVANIDFDQLDRIRKFPIFSTYSKKENKYKKNRCLIIDKNYKRILATTQIGSGTIGLDNGAVKSGLEGAFSKYLAGKDGKRLVQRINATQWKPIDYWKIQDPVDGKDVYTTLDLRIQDIAHTALEKQLRLFTADHGCVVVIEAETGKVRAMVNLRRTETGDYTDAYNYALKDATEPGSTFKTVSLLAAMDDGFINENTKINVGNGTFEYGGAVVKDDHSRGGDYDLSDILAQSSNVGTAKIIVRNYSSKPEVFINHLKRWKMHEKMDIELPGITKPYIVTPDNKRWNKSSLAWLSFGYNSRFNLLQLTTFYNGIANKGKMVKPLFIEKIMNEGKVEYEAKPEVIVNRMASPEAIDLMTRILTKTVEKGTAKSIFTPNIKLAGKTGTTQIEYWKAGPPKHQSSFAGFYPADNPKYTCIVMVNQPKGAIYGGTVAAPVFKEIAGKTFLKTPLNVDKQMLTEKKPNLNKMQVPNVKVELAGGRIPNLKGLVGKNVIPQLENQGYRVAYSGVGKIKDQFPAEGTVVGKNQRIYLTLQN